MTSEDLDAHARTIDPTEAGKLLGLSPRTLANLRGQGKGPPYLKVSGRVYYRLPEIAEYLDQCVRVPGSDR